MLIDSRSLFLVLLSALLALGLSLRLWLLLWLFLGFFSLGLLFGWLIESAFNKGRDVVVFVVVSSTILLVLRHATEELLKLAELIWSDLLENLGKQFLDCLRLAVTSAHEDAFAAGELNCAGQTRR